MWKGDEMSQDGIEAWLSRVIPSLLKGLIFRRVFVKEATFSERSHKEVEDACRKFVQGMKIEQVK